MKAKNAAVVAPPAPRMSSSARAPSGCAKADAATPAAARYAVSEAAHAARPDEADGRHEVGDAGGHVRPTTQATSGWGSPDSRGGEQADAEDDEAVDGRHDGREAARPASEADGIPRAVGSAIGGHAKSPVGSSQLGVGGDDPVGGLAVPAGDGGEEGGPAMGHDPRVAARAAVLEATARRGSSRRSARR